LFQRGDESDRDRNDQRALDRIRPSEALRHDIDALQQRERAGRVGQRRLHQLALFQPLQNVTHAAAPCIP
jgi:hypothetical protein